MAAAVRSSIPCKAADGMAKAYIVLKEKYKNSINIMIMVMHLQAINNLIAALNIADFEKERNK